MLTATFTEFRNSAKKFFDRVEKGESVEIYRHGKPVAVMSPARSLARASEYWKSIKPVFKLKPGKSAASMIVEMRRERGF